MFRPSPWDVAPRATLSESNTFAVTRRCPKTRVTLTDRDFEPSRTGSRISRTSLSMISHCRSAQPKWPQRSYGMRVCIEQRRRRITQDGVRRRARTAPALLERAEDREQPRVELRVPTEGVQERPLVGHETFEVPPKVLDRARLVDAEALLRPLGPVSAPVPDLASAIAGTHEQDRAMAAAVQPPRDQHRLGLREAREVEQVGARPVLVVDVPVAGRLRRGRQDQDPVTERVQETLTPRTVQGRIGMCISAHAARVCRATATRSKPQPFIESTSEDCTPVPPSFLVTIRNSTENSSPSIVNGAWKHRSSLTVRRCRSSPT